MSLSVDPTTNRTTRSGFQYDANGNLTNLPNVSGALSYDIENRTGSTNSLYGNLAYDMENQPLDRGGQRNLYGLNGERLGTYTYTFGRAVTYISGVDYDATLVYPAQASRNIYFGGRLIQSNNTTVGVDAQVRSVRTNRGRHSNSIPTVKKWAQGQRMAARSSRRTRANRTAWTTQTSGIIQAHRERSRPRTRCIRPRQVRQLRTPREPGIDLRTRRPTRSIASIRQERPTAWWTRSTTLTAAMSVSAHCGAGLLRAEARGATLGQASSLPSRV